MHTIEELRSRFEAALELTEFRNKPSELYEPIQYALQGGGKRVRPVCLLAACEMFGGQAFDAVNQALAVEIFHNFTLLHDDIMDEAPYAEDAKRCTSSTTPMWVFFQAMP
ncbi:polyprenyl synthetase family protein [bacterium SCSIO 12741]|nr:polyprenyl synthetase family protein [bacterium SCSIO 12741]